MLDVFSLTTGRGWRALARVVAVLCAVLASACGRDEVSAAQAASDQAPRSAQAVGVITSQAREEDFLNELEALGTARANEAVEVTSKVSNLVTAIHFREGQQVKRGAILVALDSMETAAELAAARAALGETQNQYQRGRELFQTRALSQAQLDQLEATLRANEARVTSMQSRLNDMTIRAPFDGRVGLRRVSVGSLVSPGAVITTLDDARTIKLDFAVPETFIGVLREGLPITARSVAFPDREFLGTVASIDSRLDTATRSVTVRAHVPNPEGLLRPGMFLTVRLQQDRERVLMIPEQALVPEEGRQFVFVVKDGRTRKREVSIGRRRPGRVEIVGGLAVGEAVVVEGTQKVRDGGPVQEVQPPDAAPAPT